MRFPLGIPAGVDSPLGKRLVGLTLFRFAVLGAFLIVIERFYLRELDFGGFSSLLGVYTVTFGFLASAAYMAVLRRGKKLTWLGHTQLVTDQLMWTAIVYISGGATSGSTSLYGLTCLSGAILLGADGALTAAVAGIGAYLALCGSLIAKWVPVPPDQEPAAYVLDPDALTYPIFSTVMAISVVALLASYLAERLRAFGGRLEVVTRQAKEAEELAALGRLAAGLAHEIRNPLGSIRGSIELLRMGESLDGEEQALCALVEREVTRLDELVSDMVGLSQSREPEVGDVDLPALARDVVTLAQVSADANAITIRYDGPDELGLRADPGQMRQVLWNLVRNALQVSSAGNEVVVALSRNDEGEVLMEVIDQGRGIPESRREQVFDAFFTTRSKGSGIGLAVVKGVVDRHGFEMEVDSVEGAGTTFRMRVPKAKALAGAALVVVAGLGLLGCSPSRDWVDPVGPAPGADGWWPEDEAVPSGRSPAAAPAPPPPAALKPAPDPGAAPGPAAMPLSVALKGGGSKGGDVFRNTYYDFPHERLSIDDGKRATVYDANCSPIQEVRQSFHDHVCVQGSGQLISGETISFAKRDCKCARKCPRSGQKICFEKLDPKRFPHGRGALGTPITPKRSVAVDPKVIPLETVLYIPSFHGLRDLSGTTHDGCFIAEDRGSGVQGKHVDIFTGDSRLTAAWNLAVPSNRGVQVIKNAARCKHLVKR